MGQGRLCQLPAELGHQRRADARIEPQPDGPRRDDARQRHRPHRRQPHRRGARPADGVRSGLGAMVFDGHDRLVGRVRAWDVRCLGRRGLRNGRGRRVFQELHPDGHAIRGRPLDGLRTVAYRLRRHWRGNGCRDSPPDRGRGHLHAQRLVRDVHQFRRKRELLRGHGVGDIRRDRLVHGLQVLRGHRRPDVGRH